MDQIRNYLSHFIMGIGRILDFGRSFSPRYRSIDSKSADCEAIKNDWNAVGRDLYYAIDHHPRDWNEPKPSCH